MLYSHENNCSQKITDLVHRSLHMEIRSLVGMTVNSDRKESKQTKKPTSISCKVYAIFENLYHRTCVYPTSLTAQQVRKSSILVTSFPQNYEGTLRLFLEVFTIKFQRHFTTFHERKIEKTNK